MIFNSLWKESQASLPFLDIMINKSGTKIWKNIYNKPMSTKQYNPFTSNHPRHCLKPMTIFDN